MELANKIMWILANSDVLLKMGENARETYRKHFDSVVFKKMY